MNTELKRAITIEEIDAYHRDGVVLVKDMFDADWVEILKRGLISNGKNPTHRARTWDRDAEGRTMFWDSQAWQEISEYQQFIFNSPAAELAGTLLKATEINFFFDAVFVRSPGTQFSTPWHQDEPYWSIEGYDTCTIWMPLVPVKKKNALAFVPGSHLNNQIFDQPNFGDLNPGDDARIKFRECGMDPDHSAIMTEYGLKPGDRPGTELYPKIWQLDNA